VPFGHTSPTPFGGTLPKGEGLGVVVLNNLLRNILYLISRILYLHFGGVWMPSNLFVLDAELPTFSERESPQAQVRKMFNYLVQLKQSLQYSLRNLTADNFNASALDKLTSGAKVELSQQLQLMQAAISQMDSKVDALSARLGNTEELVGRLTSLEDSDELLAGEIVGMQESLAAMEETVAGLDLLLNGEGGILDRLEAVEGKLGAVTVGEDGSLTLGTEGLPLYLVGQVFVNETPMDGGTQ